MAAFPIVAIGSSAGGLEALEALFVPCPPKAALPSWSWPISTRPM